MFKKGNAGGRSFCHDPPPNPAQRLRRNAEKTRQLVLRHPVQKVRTGFQQVSVAFGRVVQNVGRCQLLALAQFLLHRHADDVFELWKLLKKPRFILRCADRQGAILHAGQVKFGGFAAESALIRRDGLPFGVKIGGFFLAVHQIVLADAALQHKIAKARNLPFAEQQRTFLESLNVEAFDNAFGFGITERGELRDVAENFCFQRTGGCFHYFCIVFFARNVPQAVKANFHVRAKVVFIKL